MQGANTDLLVGQTASRDGVKPTAPAPQSLVQESAFGKANAAGIGPDFSTSGPQVEFCPTMFCRLIDLLLGKYAVDNLPDSHQLLLCQYALGFSSTDSSVSILTTDMTVDCRQAQLPGLSLFQAGSALMIQGLYPPCHPPWSTMILLAICKLH